MLPVCGWQPDLARVNLVASGPQASPGESTACLIIAVRPWTVKACGIG